MNSCNSSDYELVKQYIGGCQASFKMLMNRHKKRVYTFIYFNIKDPCITEDLFQDTFIKAITSLKQGRYKDEGKFIYWLLRIAHNIIIDHFRKKKLNNVIYKDDFSFDILNDKKYTGKNIERNIHDATVSSELKELLNHLPEEQKEVIILRHYLDMSFKEIANYSNISINTALGRMRYALVNLRKVIKEKNLCLSE